MHADPASVEAGYDRVVGERFDAFMRTGRRFSFIVGHPWLLKPGLRVAVGTQTTADITLRWADPLLRRTQARA